MSSMKIQKQRGAWRMMRLGCEFMHGLSPFVADFRDIHNVHDANSTTIMQNAPKEQVNHLPCRDTRCSTFLWMGIFMTCGMNIGKNLCVYFGQCKVLKGQRHMSFRKIKFLTVCYKLILGSHRKWMLWSLQIRRSCGFQIQHPAFVNSMGYWSGHESWMRLLKLWFQVSVVYFYMLHKIYFMFGFRNNIFGII